MRYTPLTIHPLDASRILNWIHFGDLHITEAHQQNYRDFLSLIDEANTHLAKSGGVNFAVLPGDNADNGTDAQFRLVRAALDRLHIPVHILPGDHDIQSGNLDLFRQWLEPELPKTLVVDGYRCVFLNSVDIEGVKGFGLGTGQLAFLKKELTNAAQRDENVAIFMHTYPSELQEAAPVVRDLFQQSGKVRLVEMGHTHYNEIANDSRVIYATTRSTGQIEEGAPGFSITCLDGAVVSWKFKSLGSAWPFVMITSPADRALLTEALPTVRGATIVRAKVWIGSSEIERISLQIDGGVPLAMSQIADTSVWSRSWDSSGCADGTHRLTVRVSCSEGEGMDTIDVITDQAGCYQRPARRPLDVDNAIGAYPEKGILGAQLGPNKNGHPW